jgi:hypothetical protein
MGGMDDETACNLVPLSHQILKYKLTIRECRPKGVIKLFDAGQARFNPLIAVEDNPGIIEIEVSLPGLRIIERFGGALQNCYIFGCGHQIILLRVNNEAVPLMVVVYPIWRVGTSVKQCILKTRLGRALSR